MTYLPSIFAYLVVSICEPVFVPYLRFSGYCSAFYILLHTSLVSSALDNFVCPVHPIDRFISAKSAIFGHSCYMFFNVRCRGAFLLPLRRFLLPCHNYSTSRAEAYPPKMPFCRTLLTRRFSHSLVRVIPFIKQLAPNLARLQYHFLDKR